MERPGYWSSGGKGHKAFGGAMEGGGGAGQGVTEMPPLCPPSTVEFQKRECRGYLGVNLKFMTSARSTVPESVTQQVCQGWL